MNVEAFFPNLKVFQLYGNSIRVVKNTHLVPFPNLVYFNLYMNQITTIDGNLFDGLNSVKYVSFERNYVRSVGHDLVLPKSGLVFFDNNPCINVRASTIDGIAALRFDLLINCTLLEPIETALKNRGNLVTDVSNQVQNVVNRVNSLESNQSELKNSVANLDILVTNLRNQVDRLSSDVSKCNCGYQN